MERIDSAVAAISSIIDAEGVKRSRNRRSLVTRIRELEDGIQRARGRPIYLVHGALDWMFPVETARMARRALEGAGARLVYREIEDLSHTYPRDENPRILDWLGVTG